MKKFFILATVLFLFAAGNAFAQSERLEASLERDQVSVGNPVYLYVTFYGGKNVSRPDVSPVDGLQIKYVGPATKISVVNGRVSQSITHTYLIVSLKEGDFEIGPFSVEYLGKAYGANAVTLIASGTPVPASRLPAGRTPPVSAPPVRGVPSSAGRPYVGDRAFLVMEIDKKKMYINEVVPVMIKLYVDKLRLDDIEYPSFSHEGFSTGKFKEPKKMHEVFRGTRYATLVFWQDIFGIKEGEYALGPARLGCKLLVKKQPVRRSPLSGRSVFDDDFFSSVFGGYQAYPLELESEKISVTILPFPKEGRPSDFQGAVGDFDLDVEVKPDRVKVGDPIVLKMTISGKGNLDTVTAPSLETEEAFKVYEPQATIKAGKKIYEQIIIPKTDEVSYTPGISFSFLDPDTGKYATIRKEKTPIKVIAQTEKEKAVKMVTVPGMERAFYPTEKLGEDIVHIKEHAGRLRARESFLYRNRLFWIWQVIPLGLFLVFYAVHREREKIRTDKGYARLLKAPRKARGGMSKAKSYLAKDDIVRFYDTIFKTLQEYLADKFNLPKGSVTPDIIEERLRRSGVDENILNMLRDAFFKCDMARYASTLPGGREANETLENVKRVIDFLEKARL